MFIAILHVLKGEDDNFSGSGPVEMFRPFVRSLEGKRPELAEVHLVYWEMRSPKLSPYMEQSAV